MKLSIFTTVTNPEIRGDNYKDALKCYTDLADETVIIYSRKSDMDYPLDYEKGNGHVVHVPTLINTWPKEFSWPIIGEHFQRGYEIASGDWVLHMDIDTIFHEKDFGTIRKAMEDNPHAPALSFNKRQIFIPDRYAIKSQVCLAVNKAEYGERIKFNGGKDLCQPTLDGIVIDPGSMYGPKARVDVWNYDCLLKTKDQVKADKGRFSRAWFNHFGEYKLGGPDDDLAFDKWWIMVTGRYKKHTMSLDISDHPIFVQDTLRNLKPEQFGYDMWGYAK